MQDQVIHNKPLSLYVLRDHTRSIEKEFLVTYSVMGLSSSDLQKFLSGMFYLFQPLVPNMLSFNILEFRTSIHIWDFNEYKVTVTLFRVLWLHVIVNSQVHCSSYFWIETFEAANMSLTISLKRDVGVACLVPCAIMTWLIMIHWWLNGFRLFLNDRHLYNILSYWWKFLF